MLDQLRIRNTRNKLNVCQAIKLRMLQGRVSVIEKRSALQGRRREMLIRQRDLLALYASQLIPQHRPLVRLTSTRDCVLRAQRYMTNPQRSFRKRRIRVRRGETIPKRRVTILKLVKRTRRRSHLTVLQRPRQRALSKRGLRIQKHVRQTTHRRIILLLDLLDRHFHVSIRHIRHVHLSVNLTLHHKTRQLLVLATREKIDRRRIQRVAHPLTQLRNNRPQLRVHLNHLGVMSRHPEVKVLLNRVAMRNLFLRLRLLHLLRITKLRDDLRHQRALTRVGLAVETTLHITQGFQQHFNGEPLPSDRNLWLVRLQQIIKVYLQSLDLIVKSSSNLPTQLRKRLHHRPVNARHVPLVRERKLHPLKNTGIIILVQTLQQ